MTGPDWNVLDTLRLVQLRVGVRMLWVCVYAGVVFSTPFVFIFTYSFSLHFPFFGLLLAMQGEVFLVVFSFCLFPFTFLFLSVQLSSNKVFVGNLRKGSAPQF